MAHLNRSVIDAILHDASAPTELRRAITADLEVYDRAAELLKDAKVDARVADERLKAIYASEPARIVDALEHGPVEVADVLPDHTDHLETAALAAARLRAVQRAVQLATENAERGAYRTAAVEVLEWVAALRAATPWPAALPDHVVAAWNACPITWHLPGLPRSLRFGRLPVSPRPRDSAATSNVHRLAWQYLEAGEVTVAPTEAGRLVVTITGDWSAVLDALVTV